MKKTTKTETLSPADHRSAAVVAGEEGAQFLNALAESIARDLRTDKTALISHLKGMSGAEGAYLCFAVMNLLGKRRDRAGMELVTQIVESLVS